VQPADAREAVDGSEISLICVGTPSLPRSVDAECFVLCAGGIENSGEADRRTIVLTANEFACQIANSELGRVRLMEWLVDDDVPMTLQKTMGAWHHMGGLE